MPTGSRNQLALDRYWQKRKSPWELGRDYKRYIGYRYETQGHQVQYQGNLQGLSDLGRDLMAVKEGTVEIIQCKYWSREKQIHEKHVFQLYGTLIEYRIDHPTIQANAVFVTSTVLSDRARQAAAALDVTIQENVPLEQYPCIKCNISRDGTKIYHLPFDQQYDRTVIETNRGECYVSTVQEADAREFRRAYRWRPVAE